MFMRIMDFILPTCVLEPERITSEIKQSYNNFDIDNYKIGSKLKFLLGGEVLLVLLGCFAFLLLNVGSSIQPVSFVVFMSPFVLCALLYALFILYGKSNKMLGVTVIVPQIVLLAVLAGLLLFFGPLGFQNPICGIVFYIVILFYAIWTVIMYRSDYKKFPEITYQNCGAKKSKLWIILLICHPIVIFLARNISDGIIGVVLLMIAAILCHYQSYLLIVARYQPQVAKIVKKKQL